MLILPPGNPIKNSLVALVRVRKRGVPYRTIFAAGLLDVARPLVMRLSKLGLCFRGTCPICGGKSIFEFKSLKFTILKCLSCDHAFVSEDLSKKDFEEKYSKSEYWEEDRIHRNIHTMAPGTHWDEFVERRMKPLIDFGILPSTAKNGKTKPKILEIGSSEGIMLHQLAQMGYDATGCEVNSEVVKRAREYFPYPVIEEDFLTHDFGDERFDLIISYHTFEHLPQLAPIAEKCSKLLSPGGSLLIEVPFGKEEYHNYDHLHFFSEESSRRLFTKWFENIRIQRSFYRTIHNTECGSYFASGTVPLSLRSERNSQG